ncbi:MAG: hypothetical protein RLY87_2149 [Chloroflexota bacterium]
MSNPPFRMRDIIDLRGVAVPLTIGVFIGCIAAVYAATLKTPLWIQAACVIAGVMPAYGLHALRILKTHGWWFAVLSMLVAAQGFHGFEHVVQWIQYHILRWPFFTASGIISAANAEWVHFGWNWIVLIIMSILVKGGLRNRFAWLMLAWTIAHTAEHTYMMMRYLQALSELAALGVPSVSAQGLPGFFGRDGWLATSDVTRSSFVCRLPGLTTAVRLDVHFWWNIGETALLMLATAREFQVRNGTKRTTEARTAFTLAPERV